jgi:hypothetical protein
MELIVLSAVGTTTVLLAELGGLVRGRLARRRRATTRTGGPLLPLYGRRRFARDVVDHA